MANNQSGSRPDRRGSLPASLRDAISADAEADHNEMARLLEEIARNPEGFARELLQSRKALTLLSNNCAASAQAAEGAAKLLEQLLAGNSVLMHVEEMYDSPSGTKVICRAGSQLREMSLHPEVRPETIRSLQPWEFACVHENVVVGVVAGTNWTLESAMGEIVSFQGFHQDNPRLVRVTRSGHGEEVVRLAASLHAPLSRSTRLVLMRDNPSLAIATWPAQEATSRFEVPLHSITTRLADLAGMDVLAEKMFAEIYLRVIRPDIRDEFHLDPLRGLILSSNKPGMGKTAFVRAFAGELSDFGAQFGFDVVLYVVKPNELKSMWHGEDARIVREDLFGAIRQRRLLPRNRSLLQILVMDEIDSLGRRPEGRDVAVSSHHSDALESLLVELDGMQQEQTGDPPAHLIMLGMTNRPDRIDDAIKRPGRFGDEVFEFPDLDQAAAEQICMIYLRSPSIPFSFGDGPRKQVPHEEITQRIVTPALNSIFSTTVLRYLGETQKRYDVSVGEIMAAVHYRKAMAVARRQAAGRRHTGIGVPAVTCEDVIDGLLEAATSVAEQMAADPIMLLRHLRINVPVTRVELVPREQLQGHRYWQPQGLAQ